ncbi:MotA/TolQ/ExbB proton channel family protein, partial [Jatrophihabitans sp. YIM 134969]
AQAARTAAAGDDGAPAATRALAGVAWSAGMAATYAQVVTHRADENAVAKDLADFDLAAQRRLARTRLLVRVGPALGLMGTLIPLAPALDGLARGNTRALTDNLQVAFSITVLGLLVGAVAFGLSLVRENMYGQDFSDLEYVVSVLIDDVATTPGDGPAATKVEATS